MEVQGSGIEDNDDMRSDVSLIDSLDDPGSPKHNRSQTPVQNESPVESFKDLSATLTPTIDDSAPPTKTSREKGESFFVPITDEYDIMDEQLVVAESMPEKLREKLERRQMELDAKKEMEFHKQFAKMNKENMNVKNKKSSIIVLSEPETIKTPPLATLQPPAIKKNGFKPKNGASKTELGMLESYTIDSRGNMQFNNNGGRGTAAIKILPKTKPAPAATNNSTAAVKKNVKNTHNEVIKVKKTNEIPKETKDFDCLTLYSNSSNLTPDIEAGPRRRFQKTEINENGNHIEILEIIECTDSSPDLQRSYRSLNSRSGESTPAKKSLIPVPVPISATTKPASSSSSIRILPNKPSGKRDKIDRVIADLLIGAINDPDSSVVELIQSPKDSKKVTVKSKHKQIAKRGSTTNVRYSQNFDVIPEERSSISSNDESKSLKSKKLQIMNAKNSERFIAMGNSNQPRSMAIIPSEPRTHKPSQTRAFDLINNNPSKSPTFIKITPTVNIVDGRPGRIQSDAPTKISPWASPTYAATSPKHFFRGGLDAIELMHSDAEPRGWMGFYPQNKGSPLFDGGSPIEGTRV